MEVPSWSQIAIPGVGPLFARLSPLGSPRRGWTPVQTEGLEDPPTSGARRSCPLTPAPRVVFRLRALPKPGHSLPLLHPGRILYFSEKLCWSEAFIYSSIYIIERGARNSKLRRSSRIPGCTAVLLPVSGLLRT